MSSLTTSPSIDNAALLSFQDSFHELAQQTKSRLVSSGAIKFLPSKGKTHNYGRIGRMELTEVDTRNPDKQYGDYNVDNRQFSKRRFTKTVTIDAKDDINELLKDPTSDILKQLNNAKERVVDRIAISVATGAVLTGAPDASPTSTSAASDGVLTVTATSGFTYSTVQSITQNFINNDVPMEVFMGSTLCITGKENTDLMNELEFISSDFISGKPVEEGYAKQAGMYSIVMFAGSENGGITVVNPILAEGASTRTCAVLAPDSVAMSMELADLRVEKSAGKVNSFDITIDFWINGLRTEGVLVQLVTTTL